MLVFKLIHFSTPTTIGGIQECSGLETDYPCGVWCRGWATCSLYWGPHIGLYIQMTIDLLSISAFVRWREICLSFFFHLHMFTYINTQGFLFMFSYQIALFTMVSTLDCHISKFLIIWWNVFKVVQVEMVKTCFWICVKIKNMCTIHYFSKCREEDSIFHRRNPLRHGDAYMRQWTGSQTVDHKEQTLLNFLAKFKLFRWRKCIWKCRLLNVTMATSRNTVNCEFMPFKLW